MDMHFITAAGDHFVVPDAPEGYSPEGATQIDPPPSLEHRWINGGWVLPEPPAPPVPQSVSRAQAKIALERVGLLKKANDLIAQAGVEAQIWWADAQTFDRNHPLIEQIGAALGLDKEAIDELFRVAATVAP